MKPDFESVVVVGLGYVGLPTAAVMASRGLRVLGVDINPKAVAVINQGKAHIVEPDLDILVNGAVSTGRLRAASAPEPADAFIVAVPTPLARDNGPDIEAVKAAALALAPVLKRGDLVVIESTSPVGTTEAMAGWLAAARPDLRMPAAGRRGDLCIAYSPERVLPGRVLLELVGNDRVVGGLGPDCAARAAALYRRFVAGECVETTARTAELVKLAENAFRDVNIAFANELSVVADRLGVDVWDAIRLANRHPRVKILNPGPGVGGHCIAVDPWFIAHQVPDATPLIRAARGVNDGMPARVTARILEAARGRGVTRVACLGLAYKADIDDLRESPALAVAAALAREGIEVLAVEPHVPSLPRALAGLPNVRLVGLNDALAAEVIALLVDHRPFRALDRTRLAGKAVVDTRGIWR